MNEKYYRRGITRNDHDPVDIEQELNLPPAPDWIRERRRVIYEPPRPSRAPRTEAFVNTVIKHQVAIVMAFWALSIGLVLVAVFWW
jgi:hypothetical protein